MKSTNETEAHEDDRNIRSPEGSDATIAEQLLPAYDHVQRFSTVIPASPAVVFAALHEVRFSDLRLLRILNGLRSFGGSEAGGQKARIFVGARVRRLTNRRNLTAH
jgi:hypothetical protein